jgi:hypothetical protein
MIARPVVFVAAAIALVGSLWFAFKPHGNEQPGPAPVVGPGPAPATGTQPNTSGQSPPASAGNHSFDLSLRDGRLVSGSAVVQVKAGDRIILRVASNQRDELHVHGYGLRLPIKPDEVVNLHFIADRTGRFPLELHRAHSALGVLEVYPQ